MFGSKAYTHIPKKNRRKPDARTKIGFEYPTGGKGYKIYDPQTHTVKLRIVVFDDASNLLSAICVTNYEVTENTPEHWVAWLPVVTIEKLADLPFEDTTEPERETKITPQEEAEPQQNHHPLLDYQKGVLNSNHHELVWRF